MDSFELMKKAVNVLNEKKGKDISAIKIDKVSDIADYFLICTATSNTHVRALADETETKLKEAGATPRHIEGRASDWILMDYGDVVIHIFGRISREFYSLDHLWNDGENIDLSGILESTTEE